MPNLEPKSINVNISSATMFKVLFIILSLFFLFYIRSIILLLFVCLLLSAAFDPAVDWLQKNKLPRAIGIFLIYLLLIVILGGSVYLIIPPMLVELKGLINDFPDYWGKISSGIQNVQDYSQTYGLGNNIQNALKSLESTFALAAGGIFNTIYAFFGGMVSFVVILVVTFYMAVEEQAVKRFARSVIPVKYQPYFTHLVNRIQEKIGFWVRGQLLSSLIIFALSWVGLFFLGVKYALILAFLTGVMELIPYFGPFVGGIAAVFIAFTQSPILAFWVIVFYIIVQQLDNHFVTPKIMEKTVGLNPIITIIAILVGVKLAGILGIILAVPVATSLSIILEDVLEIKKEEGETI